MLGTLDAKEAKALDRIVLRACARHAAFRGFASPPDLDGLRLKMDLLAVQGGPDPVDIHRLEKADEATFVRVVYGILNHLDRNSGRLPVSLIGDPRFRRVAAHAHPSYSPLRAVALP